MEAADADELTSHLKSDRFMEFVAFDSYKKTFPSYNSSSAAHRFRSRYFVLYIDLCFYSPAAQISEGSVVLLLHYMYIL